MTKSIGYSVSKFLFIGIFTTLFSGLLQAEGSKASILNKYTSHGFECLDISQTINSDTMKEFADFDGLKMSDKVHVCIKTDMSQELIAGNKYVVVFDKDGGMKTENQVPSIFDKE